MTEKNKWDIGRPPPKNHPDLGEYIYGLFEKARDDRDRQGVPERWQEAFNRYRGQHWAVRNSKSITLNFHFADIHRIVANLTARDPVSTVVSVDGIDEGNEDIAESQPQADPAQAPLKNPIRADDLINQKIKDLWSDTGQKKLLRTTLRNGEIYGPAIEKYIRNDDHCIDVIPVDPFSFFPCPGYMSDIGKVPYIIHAYAKSIDDIEKKFKPKADIEPDSEFSDLADDRDEVGIGTVEDIVNYNETLGGTSPLEGGVSAARSSRGSSSGEKNKTERALVIEAWIRDYSTESVEVVTTNDITGETTTTKSSRSKYPGNIRRVTVTNKGQVVLADVSNPNINENIDAGLHENFYGYDRFPFAMCTSFDDNTSIWGFALSEQTFDIDRKINELISRIYHHVSLASCPPFIVPEDCGIHQSKIDNSPGLILRPINADMSQHIRFVPVPPVSSDAWQLVNFLMQARDRIAAIQDVDRGDPGSVTAASAIVALQDRNAVLMNHKVGNTDYIVRERGKWMINFLQNFHHFTESIAVNDEYHEFTGSDYRDRNFNFSIEVGSTYVKTQVKEREEALELYKMGVTDREHLLETLGVDGRKKLLERAGEGQVEQALEILVSGGFPEELVPWLREQVMAPQGGPGDMTQTNPMSTAVPQPGMPTAMQGQMPPPVTG